MVNMAIFQRKDCCFCDEADKNIGQAENCLKREAVIGYNTIKLGKHKLAGHFAQHSYL